MDHTPQAWGRPRDDVYGAYDASYLSSNGPKQATQAPIVTGTSVIALKFKGGVVMAADNLASYGSLARFTDTLRLRPFGKEAVVGFSGDVSDMQFLDRHLTNLEIEESYSHEGDEQPENDDDDDREKQKNKGLNAANIHTYLGKLFYGRRNKFDPLWNQVLVAGFDNNDDVFLACVDLRGTTYAAPSLATGYGAALAQPVMRRVAETEEQVAQLTQEQAVAVIKECMKVLYYRDARSLDTYSMAIVTKGGGVTLTTDEKLEQQSWAFAERIRGYGTQTV
ncbi:20S proteasome subunit beta 7 [Sporothrix brasiliensis 5110]|uniref:Proteasome subunit beta n=1 Tax=Sporothrix brasiliensis 5110 TaxID=1398154 RepID=A0A0C2J167_9PEZI|nr:20S proteasome subunit beta 7 [Sporothrix brasiliensis 5110]KIH92760.1 20S proteasome subunit beta 7 [Sporothrix brasiliensis 5110]